MMTEELVKSRKEWKAKQGEGQERQGKWRAGAGDLQGRAKTEGKVRTGHWAKGGTLSMMEPRTQGRG